MKKALFMISLMGLCCSALLLTACGPSWYLVKTSPGLYIKTEAVLQPGLLALIRAKRNNLKIVLRVPSPPKNVTSEELMQMDKRYDFFERELAKAGFIVRDRALLDKILSEEKTPSYQDIYNKIDTDLIIEIIDMSNYDLSTRDCFDPTSWSKYTLPPNNEKFLVGKFLMAGGRLDCRIINVKDGTVAGMLTIYYLPCGGGPCDFELNYEEGVRNPEPNPDKHLGYDVGNPENNARNLAQIFIQTITDHDIAMEQVQPGSLADKNGLKVNDIILTINGQPIYNRSQLTEIISQTDGTITLEILRDGQKITISFTKKLGEPIGFTPKFTPVIAK